MHVNQPPEHRPVLVTPRLLRLNKVRDREQIDVITIQGLDRRAPLPKLIERSNAAHHRHHVDADAGRVGVLATRVDRVSALEIRRLERRGRRIARRA